MAKLSEENEKLDKKSKDNKRAAQNLSDMKIFHAAVSRLYYSAYQKSLCYQREYCDYQEKDEDKSSHNSLINDIDVTIKDLMSDSTLKMEAMRSIHFKPIIRQLKDARVESDYKAQDDFTDKEYKVIKDKYNKISEALNNYRNVLEKR